MYGDHSDTHEKVDWDAERQSGGATMRFWQKPIVRQYFHKGLLWRAQEAQEVASYELFTDLLYVGIIAITGDNASEHATGESLVHFAITFILGWKIWSDISVLISWFDSDDILRRLSILFILTCLLGFTVNMVGSFARPGTYTPLVAFYLASRLFIATYYAYTAWLLPMIRPAMLGNCLCTALPAALWIGSIYLREPQQQALIWVAIWLDIFSYTFLVMLMRGGNWMGPRFRTVCVFLWDYQLGEP